MLLDVGANADCRPIHLLQFAYMGAAYMEKMFKVPSPRVGLISIGEETRRAISSLSRSTRRSAKAA
jgi:glycerol-3-phosphate acyltransferase PlsX